MRPFGRLAIALLLVLSIASPGLARVAAIQTSAPLKDHSEQSINVAVMEAINTAARAAVAMGLPWVQVRGAFLLEDAVTVQILATDTEPGEEEEKEEMEPEAGGDPGTGSGPPELSL